MRITLLVLLAVLLSSAAGAVPPERGRDPWVFRQALENKPRMVVIAARKDAWLAYNPANGCLERFWAGGIEYRGKVYDFSQNNSRCLGPMYHDQSGLVLDTARRIGRNGWTTVGVNGTGPWTFTEDESILISPRLDLRNLDRVMINFDETGRAGRFAVAVSPDDGITWTETFQSATHVSSETDWQFNARLIESRAPRTRLRFTQRSAAHGKQLRHVRVEGDRRVWRLDDGPEPETTVVWRGYRLAAHGPGVGLGFDVRSGATSVQVFEAPEVSDAPAGRSPKLTRTFSVSGMTATATLRLRLDDGWSGARVTLDGIGALVPQDDGSLEWVVRNNGAATIIMDWPATGDAP